MRETKLLIAAVILCLAVLAMSPSVSAESEITVAVNGENVADGETVEVGLSPFVNVTVESDTTITSVRTGIGSSYSINSVDTGFFQTARNITVLNEEEFTVEANEASDEYTHTVTLTRPSETPRDFQREVRSIRRDIESMEEEADRLEERRKELRQRNENLTRRLNETRAELDNGSEDGDGDDGQGLPGFTVVAALVALSLVALAARYRRT